MGFNLEIATFILKLNQDNYRPPSVSHSPSASHSPSVRHSSIMLLHASCVGNFTKHELDSRTTRSPTKLTERFLCSADQRHGTPYMHKTINQHLNVINSTFFYSSIWYIDVSPELLNPGSLPINVMLKNRHTYLLLFTCRKMLDTCLHNSNTCIVNLGGRDSDARRCARRSLWSGRAPPPVRCRPQPPGCCKYAWHKIL